MKIVSRKEAVRIGELAAIGVTEMASTRKLLASHAALAECLRGAVEEFTEYNETLNDSDSCCSGCGKVKPWPASMRLYVLDDIHDIHSCPRILAHRERVKVLEEYDKGASK